MGREREKRWGLGRQAGFGCGSGRKGGIVTTLLSGLGPSRDTLHQGGLLDLIASGAAKDSGRRGRELAVSPRIRALWLTPWLRVACGDPSAWLCESKERSLFRPQLPWDKRLNPCGLPQSPAVTHLIVLLLENPRPQTQGIQLPSFFTSVPTSRAPSHLRKPLLTC